MLSIQLVSGFFSRLPLHDAKAYFYRE